MLAAMTASLFETLIVTTIKLHNIIMREYTGPRLAVTLRNSWNSLGYIQWPITYNTHFTH
jgi:hypothetical protein